MSAFWKRWAARIDARSVRERVFLFVSVALALVALTDALVLSPRAAAQKAMTAKLRTQAEELANLRQQIATMAPTPQGPAAGLQGELKTVQAERANVDEEIQRRIAGGSTAARLTGLFERVLQRHERVVLVRFASSAATPAAPGSPPMHGVELTLQGNYTDLTAYVADLEQSLTGLRWDELVIVNHKGATELRAKVAFPGETP